MCKKINNYLFQKRAQQYLSKMPRERRFVNYQKAKTVLLLFESDLAETNSVTDQIISQLQLDGKKVMAWGYVNKKESITAILPDFKILNNNQINFFKKPLDVYCTDIKSHEFDLMIDLSVNSLIPLQYLSLFANASCKAGVKKTDLPIFDFVIDIDNHTTIQGASETQIDEKYIFDQIIFYLKSIQTKD